MIRTTNEMLVYGNGKIYIRKKNNKKEKKINETLDFTVKLEDAFYDAVELAEFQDKNEEVILRFLKSKMQTIPFGDYLKRYLYLGSAENSANAKMAKTSTRHLSPKQA